MTPARQFWTLQTALPAIGGLLTIIGVEFDQRTALDAGLAVLAAAAAATGAACIRRRRVVVLRRELDFGFKLMVYEGVAALFAGSALVALGAGIAWVAVRHASGTSALEIRNTVLAHPGWPLALIGFVLLSMGVAYLIGFSAARGVNQSRTGDLIVSLPDRLGGLILSLLGTALLAIDLCALIAPAWFDAAIERLKGSAP